MPITISIFLDTRRIKKTSKYPVKLRVISGRASRNYETIFDRTREDNEKLSAPRISSSLQSIKESIREIKRFAKQVLDDTGNFTFPDFEKNFVFGNKYFVPRKCKVETATTDTVAIFDY